MSSRSHMFVLLPFSLVLSVLSTFVLNSASEAVESEEITGNVAVPFVSEQWQVLKYSSLKPNVVKFVPGQYMLIEVDESSSPLIFPLKRAQNIRAVSFSAQVQGDLKLNPEKTQGDNGNDDFLLRVGLVYEGKEKLSFLKRQFAPAWVKKLFSLAPSGTGVSHIHFLNLFSDSKLQGKSRKHPQSKLLTEEFVVQKVQNGKVKGTFKVASDKKVLAIWVSSDGDDTGSKYSVKINQIQLIAK